MSWLSQALRRSRHVLAPAFQDALQAILLRIISNMALDNPERALMQQELATLMEPAVVIDTDGDGVPDAQDAEPNNPHVGAASANFGQSVQPAAQPTPDFGPQNPTP